MPIFDDPALGRPAPVRTITKSDFVARFTDMEKVALIRASQTDDAVTLIKLAFDTAPVVMSLESADVSAALDVLIAKGILAAGRKAEILA